MTLKAGTLVKFKWAGFHDLAVSKKNEFGKRSESLPLGTLMDAAGCIAIASLDSGFQDQIGEPLWGT